MFFCIVDWAEARLEGVRGAWRVTVEQMGGTGTVTSVREVVQLQWMEVDGANGPSLTRINRIKTRVRVVCAVGAVKRSMANVTVNAWLVNRVL